MHVEAESVLPPGFGGHRFLAALHWRVQVVMNAVVAALGVKLRLALLHRTRLQRVALLVPSVASNQEIKNESNGKPPVGKCSGA